MNCSSFTTKQSLGTVLNPYRFVQRPDPVRWLPRRTRGKRSSGDRVLLLFPGPGPSPTIFLVSLNPLGSRSDYEFRNQARYLIASNSTSSGASLYSSKVRSGKHSSNHDRLRGQGGPGSSIGSFARSGLRLPMHSSSPPDDRRGGSCDASSSRTSLWTACKM